MLSVCRASRTEYLLIHLEDLLESTFNNWADPCYLALATSKDCAILSGLMRDQQVSNPRCREVSNYIQVYFYGSRTSNLSSLTAS